MALRLCLTWLAASLLMASRLMAAPPTITAIAPRGAERAKPVEVLISGTNLTAKTRLLLPFRAAATQLPEPKPNPTTARFRITVDPTVPLGIYPVRIATDDGISSVALFCVDALPNVNELEDNNTPEKAQKLTLPVIVTGQCAGGDVDFYRCNLKKGQRLVVETETARLGSGVLPQLRITDSRLRFLAADDSQSAQGECRVTFVAPADDDYLIEFSDTRYRGGNPPHYRLKLGDYDVVGEVFPLGGRRGQTVEFVLRGGTLTSEVRLRKTLNDSIERGLGFLGLDGVLRPGVLNPRVAVGDFPERLWLKTGGKEPRALDLLPPVTVNSRLEQPGDTDRFQVAVKEGQRLRIAVQAESLRSALDGVLMVSDQAGRPLATVDDVDVPPLVPGLQATRTADPSLDFTVPPGVSLLVLQVRDQRKRGGVNFGYRLTVETTEADFVLQARTAEVNVPRGGSAVVPVSVVRRGLAGPLRLTAIGLPAGWTVQGGNVPAGATAGVLTLTAAPDTAEAGPFSFVIEGTGKSEAGEMRRRAEYLAILSRDPGVALPAIPLPSLAVGLAPAEPFALRGPASVEVVRGYSATVTVTLNRTGKDPLPITEVTGSLPTVAQGQPAPLTFKPEPVAAGATTAVFTVTAAATAPEGQPFDLVPEGKAKVANVDRVVSGPAVAVTVVPPFTVELVGTALEVKAGGTATLKGRVKRHPLFKEAVKLQVAGLPAGVALPTPPMPLVPAQTDFQIDVKADANAAGRMANATLTFNTTIAAMPYTAPVLTVPVRVLPAR